MPTTDSYDDNDENDDEEEAKKDARERKLFGCLDRAARSLAGAFGFAAAAVVVIVIVATVSAPSVGTVHKSDAVETEAEVTAGRWLLKQESFFV